MSRLCFNRSSMLITVPPFPKQVSRETPAIGTAIARVSAAGRSRKLYQGLWVRGAASAKYRLRPVQPPGMQLRRLRASNLERRDQRQGVHQAKAVRRGLKVLRADWPGREVGPFPVAGSS